MFSNSSLSLGHQMAGSASPAKPRRYRCVRNCGGYRSRRATRQQMPITPRVMARQQWKLWLATASGTSFLVLSNPVRACRAPLHWRRNDSEQGGHYRFLTSFFPCNAHCVNAKIAHSGGGGHGTPVPPVPPPMAGTFL